MRASLELVGDGGVASGRGRGHDVPRMMMTPASADSSR